MKRTLLLIVVSLLSVNGFAQTRRAARAVTAPTLNAKTTTQTLPIRRVILYSNGVAYIERRGTVTGHAEIDLSFKQSQVDDVLKSMVVLGVPVRERAGGCRRHQRRAWRIFHSQSNLELRMKIRAGWPEC